MSSDAARPQMFWGLAVLLGAIVLGGVGAGSAAAQPPQQGAEEAPGAEAPEQPAAEAPAAAQHRYWTTDWSFQSIDAGTLLRRLRAIGIDVPVEAEGEFSVAFSVSIPLDALRDGRAYRFEGRLSSSQLRVDQLVLRNFAARVSYANGQLDLDELTTQLTGATAATPAGLLSGQGTAQLQPRGTATASLTADSVAIAPIHDLVLSATRRPDEARLRGVVDGSVEISAPVEGIGDPARWNARAELRGRELAIDDLPPLAVDTGEMTIREGRFRAPELRVTSAAAPDVQLSVAATVELTGRQQFEASVRGNDVPLQSLVSLAMLEATSVVTGKLDLDAQGTGELGEGTWDIGGRVASPQLLVMGLDLGLLEHRFEFNSQQLRLTSLAEQPSEAVKLQRIAADYELTPAAVRLSQLSAQIFGGSVEGQATLPRSAGESVTVDLRWEGIQPQIRTGPFAPVDTVITVQTSGQIDWTAPAGALDRPATHRGEADIVLADITIGDAPVGELEVHLTAEQGMLQLAGQGNLFGGQVRVETSRQVAAEMRWSDLVSLTPGTTVTIDGVELARLAQLSGDAAPRRWTGTASGQIVWTEGEPPTPSPAAPQVALRLTARDVTLNRLVLTPRLTMQLRLADGTLLVDRVDGSYAGGGLQATGRWSLVGGPRQLQVRAWELDAERAFLPLSPDADSWASGLLAGRMTVAGSDQLRLRGSVNVRRGAVASVPVGTAHGSFSGSLSPGRGRWQFDFHKIRGRLGGGRLLGEAQFGSSRRRGGFDLNSRWRADRVDFTTLVAETGGSNTFARGNLTGTLVLNGRGIRSSEDLDGRFDMALGGTEARAVPGLTATQNYLGGASLASVRFDQGRARGVIGGGALRFSELWLTSDRLRVWAAGLMQLDNGRLDMDAVIATGNFETQNAALLVLAEQFALQSAFPVVALVELNQLLSDRMVVVDLWGTVSDPRVRLRPLESIRESAARFILREATQLLNPLGAEQTWVQPQFFGPASRLR